MSNQDIHDVELSQPLEYSSKGQAMEAKSITLYAPTRKAFKHNAKLKQLTMQAMASMAESRTASTADSSENELRGKDLMTMLYASDIDIDELSNTFQTIVTNSSAAKIGDETITEHLLDKLSMDDYDNLMGEYIVTFLLGDMLNG